MIMIVLAVALFGVGQAVGVMSHSISVVTAHHPASGHSHANDVDVASEYAEHRHADHQHPGDDQGDQACSSVCCTFACHAVLTLAASFFASPAFGSGTLSPTEARVLFGGAPPGLDRPPRTA
jgi:hypothetical protein